MTHSAESYSNEPLPHPAGGFEAVPPTIDAQDISMPISAAETISSMSFASRLGDTLHTLFREELPEDGHRWRRVGAFALGATTQALDRGRAMVLAVPFAFDRSVEFATEHGLNGYGTAALAALAVGGTFGVWSQVVGKSFHTAINAFPETTKVTTRNHPVMVRVIGKAINGFPSQEELAEKQPNKPEEGYDVGPYDTAKTRLGKVALGIKRGFKTAFLYGSTAHVGVAKVSEHSDASNKRRRQVISLEAAGASATVAAGMSAMLTHNLFGVAEEVRDAITDKTNLSLAALAFIGLAAAGNYFERKKEANGLLATSDAGVGHVRNGNAANVEAFLASHGLDRNGNPLNTKSN